jgi:hypothetical protein
MRPNLCLKVFICLFLLLPARLLYGYELKTEYTTIVYDKDDLLRQFNREVSLGSLSYLLRDRKSFTIAEEVKNKIDVLVERVESILDMFPGQLRFKVVLLPAQADLQRVYRIRYGTGTDFISYYSPGDKAVYVSVEDVRIGVLAHEFAHAVVDRYFGVSPPTKIHEVLAQFVETHLKD